MRTVVYDEQCSLCCTLAAYAARRAPDLKFVTRSFFFSSIGDIGLNEKLSSELTLIFYDQEQVYGGADAWEQIIKFHPDLKALGWIAEKLGIGKKVARAFEITGWMARGKCPQCKKPPVAENSIENSAKPQT